NYANDFGGLVRRLGRILSLVLLAAVSGCGSGLGLSDNPKLLAFGTKSDQELTQMSEGELRDVVRAVFGAKLADIDPKAIDQMFADPVKMRRDLEQLMPKSFAAVVAIKQGSKEDLSAVLAKNVDEKQALEKYLQGVLDYYAPKTKPRRAALNQRFGQWFSYLSPEAQQRLIWNDAEFERAMTDDAYALQLVNAGVQFQRDVLASDEVSTSEQDTAY